jgi:hypothetical protein
LVGPVGECGDEAADESFEAAVHVDREREVTGEFEGDESVEG